MGRSKVALGVIALMFSAVASIPSVAAGAEANCVPPGDGGAAGLTQSQQTVGDFDGDGQTDTARIFYDPNDDFMVLTQVTLANGFQAFYESNEGAGQIATFLGVRDIDRDGDDEILVNIFPMAPEGPVDLYALAGCQLVKADGTDGEGQPIDLRGGPGTLVMFGLDCFAPAAGGRGVTQYRAFFTGDYTTASVDRFEYRLVVDDAGTDATLRPARTSAVSLDLTKANHVALLEYANSVNCGRPPKCDGKRVTIQGTPFKDKVVGTGGADVVAALGGNDVITTKGKGDLVCAGAGRDTVTAGGGDDTVFGQGGADTMKGGRGRDRLDGGPGKDSADGGPGADTCIAESKQSC